jgi:hypothetical protein
MSSQSVVMKRNRPAHMPAGLRRAGRPPEGVERLQTTTAQFATDEQDAPFFPRMETKSAMGVSNFYDRNSFRVTTVGRRRFFKMVVSTPDNSCGTDSPIFRCVPKNEALRTRPNWVRPFVTWRRNYAQRLLSTHHSGAQKCQC